MTHFTQKIQTEYGLLNFYFNLIITPNGPRFHVSAIGKQNHVLVVNMEQVGENWRLVADDSKEYFLLDIEKKLSEAIVEYIDKGL